KGSASEVTAGLDALAAQVKASSEVERRKLEQEWHEIQDLLVLPFVEPSRRLVLLRRARDISGELNATEKTSTAPAVTARQNARTARAAAVRQGRLAVAVLGEAPEAAEARHAIDKPEEGAWWNSLDRAGELIGAAFFRLGKEASAGTEQARKAPLDEAATLL